jgi:hypothetical protein
MGVTLEFAPLDRWNASFTSSKYAAAQRGRSACHAEVTLLAISFEVPLNSRNVISPNWGHARVAGILKETAYKLRLKVDDRVINGSSFY